MNKRNESPKADKGPESKNGKMPVIDLGADGLRYPKGLLSHQGIIDELNGFTPKNQIIDFAVGLSAKMKKNKFEAGNLDGYIQVVTIPVGMDTSIPVLLTINFTVNDPKPGTIELLIKQAQIKIGSLLNGSHPIDHEKSDLILVEASEQNILKQVQISIPVSELIPNEILVFSIVRDSTGNQKDTYIGNLNVVSISAVGYFWTP